MNKIEAIIENLQRQMLIASNRINKLENFTQPLAHTSDQKQYVGENYQPPLDGTPHQKELDVYEREIQRRIKHEEHLERKITELKEEREDKCALIVELKNLYYDLQGKIANQCIIITDYREKYEASIKERDSLRLNNRYQTGFDDGANATIRQVREMAAKLKS